MSSMNWLINGRFLSQSITGVQRYAREIVCGIDRELAREGWQEDIKVELCVPDGATDIPHLQKIALRHLRGLRGHVWDQITLPLRQRCRILSLCNTGPLAAGAHIVCIHDINTRLAPESYGRGFRMAYRWLIPAVARRAEQVFTVSRFSADAIGSAGMVPRDTIRIAHNGHEHALAWHAERSRLAPMPRPYVFMLGSVATHKNIGIVLQNAEALNEMGLDLVIAGGSEQIFAAYPIARHNNVRWLGRVSDDDLAKLFGNAMCFAFPSIIEGFGTPLLEAMVHGCPILSSSSASLPEVAGDAALYASPHDAAAWLASIRQLHLDSELRETLRHRGREQAKKFSWSDSAALYLAEMRALSGLKAKPSR